MEVEGGGGSNSFGIGIGSSSNLNVGAGSSGGNGTLNGHRAGSKRAFSAISTSHDHTSDMPGAWPSFGSGGNADLGSEPESFNYHSDYDQLFGGGGASPPSFRMTSPRLSPSPVPATTNATMDNNPTDSSTNTASPRASELREGLALPRRYEGDGLDFRRPVQSEVIDLTDEDVGEDTQGTTNTAATGEAGPSNLLAEQTVIDLDDDDSEPEVEGQTAQQQVSLPGMGDLGLPDPDHPRRVPFRHLTRFFGNQPGRTANLRPASATASGRSTRQATPLMPANQDAPIDLTADNDDNDDDDDVVITETRQRENAGVNLEAPGTTAGAGTRSAPQQTVYDNIGRIAGLMRGIENNRLRQRVEAYARQNNPLHPLPSPVEPPANPPARTVTPRPPGWRANDQPRRRAEQHLLHLQYQEAQLEHGRQYVAQVLNGRNGGAGAVHGNNNNNRGRPQPRVRAIRVRHLHDGGDDNNIHGNRNIHNRPPHFLQAYVGNMMDYDTPAFDMGFAGGNGPPERAYTPPSAPEAGFTRSPADEGQGAEAVVCPNCGDELAVGADEVKQQIWVVKGCGHAYCGECAHNRAKSKRNSKATKCTKGKGKERATHASASASASSPADLPLPFKKCVVAGCEKLASAKSMMLIYPGS